MKKDIRLQNLTSQDWSNVNLRGATFQCNLTEKMNLRGAKMQGIKAHATSFTTVDFTGAKLTDASDITGGLFHGCSMRSVDFSGANLAGTLFYQCDLAGADFTRAQLRGAVFNECRLSGALWPNANLEMTSFIKCRMDRASFAKSNLANAVFTDCKGERLSFENAILTGSMFNSVDFPNSKLTGAQGDDLSIVKSSFKNAVFSTAKGIFRARSMTVRDSNLQKAKFDSAYLYRAHITGDFFSQMLASGCSFRNATLVNSYFAADLRGASFINATADYVHFVQCDCRRAVFKGAKLRGATLVKGSFTEKLFAPAVWPAWTDRCQGIETRKKT